MRCYPRRLRIGTAEIYAHSDPQQPWPCRKKIIKVADVPRTVSGKIVELAVCSVVHGEAVTNAALANPEALQYFRDTPELHSVVHGEAVTNAALANPEALQYFRDSPELHAELQTD